MLLTIFIICILFSLLKEQQVPIDTIEYRFDDEPCTPQFKCGSLGYNSDYISRSFITELYAQVWYPQEIKKKAPLIMLVHGNHPPCGIYKGAGQYRKDNKKLNPLTNDCADPYFDGDDATEKSRKGYVEVPQHLGYTYLAEHLARQGYIVVSVNQNRGISGISYTNCKGDCNLILVRGRSILTHMLLLSQWANGNGPEHPLKVSISQMPHNCSIYLN